MGKDKKIGTILDPRRFLRRIRNQIFFYHLMNRKITNKHSFVRSKYNLFYNIFQKMISSTRSYFKHWNIEFFFANKKTKGIVRFLWVLQRTHFCFTWYTHLCCTWVIWLFSIEQVNQSSLKRFALLHHQSWDEVYSIISSVQMKFHVIKQFQLAITMKPQN